jgi:hypothetical protein
MLLLENDQNLIAEMKQSFEQYFTPIDQGRICVKDIITLVQRMAKSNNLSGSTDACKYLSRFKAALMIKTEQDVRYVIETAITLAKLENKSRLEGQYVLMGIIIHYIQRREHTLNEIIEKLKGLETETGVKVVVSRMDQGGQLIRSGDYYRIAPNLGKLRNNQRSIEEF